MKANQAFRRDTDALLDTGRMLGIATVIVGAVVAIALVAALAPTFFDSLRDVNENFSTADTGDTTANSIANTVFPILIALAGLFGLVGIVLAAVKLKGR